MTSIPDFDSFPSIAHGFYAAVQSMPEKAVYRQAQIDPASDSPDTPRTWESRTFREVADRIKKIAHYLRSIGVNRGDKVAIVSSSRPEWMEADIAAHTLGAIVVSVYQSLPAEDIGYILFDSGSDVIFAENQEQVDKLVELLSGPIDIPGTEERDASKAQIGIKKVIAFESVSEHSLVESFETILAGPEPADLDTYQQITRDDLAALVYTSGTTGPPKGVMQTHGNHLANVRQAYQCKLVDDGDLLMVFLPLAHAFARLMGYLGFLGPCELAFPGIADRKTSKINPDSTTKDIREAGATIIPVVPRLLEKMQAGVAAKARAGGIGGTLIGSALWSAEKVYAKQAGPVEQIVYALTGVFRKAIKKKLFGTELAYLISGGAKLNPQVARFFDMLGILILEGYGLTETCVATNINRVENYKIGSVGPVLTDDIELMITDDGEICYRGPNITKGYYNRDTATKSSWDEQGWFHTGDLGELDEEGFLSIVGRKKDILVTSYGKNIAPEDIEAQMKSSRYISQIVMLGDGRPYCTALLSLDLPAVSSWAKKQGITELDNESLSKNEKVKDLLWKEIEKVNAELANYETVKKIEIVPEDFTVENGMLTPTFKVKRPVVKKVYTELIEGMYS